MPTARFSHARIEGICTVPGQIERRIDDEIDLFGGDAAQIARLKKAVGLDRRRVAAPSTTALDLCAHAAITLLDAMGRDPAAIDALICVTQTPDHSQPSNAARLQARLGLGTGSACFDVNLGCSGFVYGLYLASLMVEAGGCQGHPGNACVGVGAWGGEGQGRGAHHGARGGNETGHAPLSRVPVRVQGANVHQSVW